MAILGPFLTPFVSIGGELTSVTSCTISYGANAVPVTAFGDGTEIHAGGLKNWSATVELNYNTADAHFATVGTTVAFAMRPTTAAAGATNKHYSGSAMVETYETGGGVGDNMVITLGLVSAGALTSSTSS